MACSIEMLPCDQCGREVERYNIYVVKDEAGKQQWVCPECAGQGEEKTETPMPDCS